ncbi:MAG: SpoIIE family protein phosphatase [Acidobacteriaceae bacterium]|nr:SpoIIE family protein phosphatase [Acidobacteriaceae bacterium]
MPIKNKSRKPGGSGKSTPAPEQVQQGQHFEGDYRPAAKPGEAAPAAVAPVNIRVEPISVSFLHRLADALNTTLDLNTLMNRVADLVRAVIDYQILAILLLNERTQDLRIRFQIGHAPETERIRVKLGQGISGQAALERRSILAGDVRAHENYINANPQVRSELAVPLIVKNRAIGVIDLQSETPDYFTHEHMRLLELAASRMASAIENARLYTRVSRQAQTLIVLNEISREITSILDLDDLLERIGLLLKRVVDYQMFSILLWNERTHLFEYRFTSRYGEQVVRKEGLATGEGIIGSAAQQRQPVLVPDVRKDARYLGVNPETRSELALPLIHKGQVMGVMALEHTRVNYYNDDHLRTLATLAAQVAISIANARLVERISEEEQRMENDLEMARRVQLRLMPPSAPRLPGAEFAAKFQAARSIGGDIYDFLDYGPDRVAVAIGDVSGKAAPAALYAALVSGILRSLAPLHLSPAELLKTLNDQLQERKLDSQYVTMLIAVWDDSNQTLRVANAGSVQPLFVTARDYGSQQVEVTPIHVEGIPLGMFNDVEYEEFTISTRPGDLVVFCSDGITDAENQAGEMFGVERLQAVLALEPLESAPATVEAILKAVSGFQAGVEHFDDETVVVLRVL